METNKKEETPNEKPKKTKPKYVLPTPRISFQKQLDLLRAWATTSGGNQTVVTTTAVAKVLGIHASTASIANPFFEKTRLLKRSGRGFIPSQEVVAFNSAHKWKPESAAKKLWPVFRETWFAGCLLPKLAFNSLSEVEAINILGEEAEAEKKSRPQLKMLLDFLNAADVIRRERGNILPGSENGDLQQNGESLDTEQPKQPHEPMEPRQPAPHLPPSSTQGAVEFNINVKLNMAELAGWAPDRITAFFTGLSMVLAAKGEETKHGGQS